MSRELASILKLRVPVIVRIGERRMPLDDVLALSPGAIIELPKLAERPLDLMVNNKVIGLGNAVKIGENFGIRVLDIGDASTRIRAMAVQQEATRRAAEAEAADDAAKREAAEEKREAEEAEEAAASEKPPEPAQRR